MSYTITALDYLDPTPDMDGFLPSAYAQAINASSQVAGYIEELDGTIHAVRWNGTTPTQLDAFDPAWDARAYGINDDGTVVGQSGSVPDLVPYVAAIWVATTPDGSSGLDNMQSINNGGVSTGVIGTQAYIWDGATATALDFLSGGAISYGYAINEANQVAGWSDDGSQLHAVIWDGTTPTALDYLSGGAYAEALAINETPVVGGASTDPTDQWAVVWNGTTATQLDSLAATPADVVWGINESDVRVGQSFDNSNQLPVVWNGTTIEALPLLSGGYAGVAFGINDSGVICGNCNDADGNIHAVIWTPSDGYWGVLLS